jgi:L,D-peptidoglycan transpeptidase YkuD (ErfK/YbiS/YcfS/YnhG family)
MYTYVVNLNQINNPAYTKLSFSTVGKKKVWSD